jgi:hypothetical protein
MQNRIRVYSYMFVLLQEFVRYGLNLLDAGGEAAMD